MMFCDIFWSTHHYIVTICARNTIDALFLRRAVQKREMYSGKQNSSKVVWVSNLKNVISFVLSINKPEPPRRLKRRGAACGSQIMLNEWNGGSTFAGGERCEGLRSSGLGRCRPRAVSASVQYAEASGEEPKAKMALLF